MNHDRRLLLVVLVCVFQLKTLRQVVVYLNSAQLPATANSVLYHEVELRAIEGSFTVFNLGGQSFLLTSFLNGTLGQCPVFVRTYIFVVVVGVAERNLSLELKAESLEHHVDDVHHIEELLFHLVRTAEEVSVILSERTYTGQAMELA